MSQKGNLGGPTFNIYFVYGVVHAFYIEDVLYTVSDDMVKANILDGLEEINKIDLDE